MTVKELIEELEKYPNDTEVEFTNYLYEMYKFPIEEYVKITGINKYLKDINILYLY